MNALRNWRKRRNVSIEAMATAIGISIGSLSRIERGEQWPPRETFARILDVTDGEVTANDFVAGDASPLAHAHESPPKTGDAA